MSYRGIGIDPFPALPEQPIPGIILPPIPGVPSSIPGLLPGVAPVDPVPPTAPAPLTQAESLLAFMKFMDTKTVQGHTIRVVKPEIVAGMRPQEHVVTTSGKPFIVHGVSFLNVSRGAQPITKDSQKLRAFIETERAQGNGIAVSLEFANGPGTKPTGSSTVSTRNVAKVAALNAADPTSFVLYEPSAGWVVAGDTPPLQKVDPVDPAKKVDPAGVDTDPNYVLWAAGAAAVLVVGAAMMKKG